MTSKFVKLIFTVFLFSIYANSYAQFPHAALGSSYYDKPKGKVQTYTWRVYNVDTEGKKLLRVYRFEYDKEGRLLKEIRSEIKYGKEDPTTRYTDLYTYDKQGKIARVTYLKPHDELLLKDIYTYSTLTHLTEIQSESPAGVVKSECLQLKMDASGKLLTKYFYWTGYEPGPMRLLSTTSYKYDAKGRRIEEMSNDAKIGNTSKVTIKYNQNGDRSQIIDLSQIRKDPIINYTYNNYDSHHNWLVRNQDNVEASPNLVEREITYYK